MLAEQICKIFNQCFSQSHTILVGGASEPLYEPGELEARVYFREDYASSALHEIAHWCIAGAGRRQETDYGYWYRGERDLKQQRTFETVEVKPQALEWIFSVAAGIDFRVSCDNFDESTLDMGGFRAEVHTAVIDWLDGLPPRAEQFVHALVEQTGNQQALACDTYGEPPK
jgi:elongation factor P hydroxylase